MSTSTRQRPTVGEVEQRDAPVEQAPAVDGRRLHGRIPYSLESRDLGGWREIIEPGALAGADLTDLIATREHDRSHLLGRHPSTLTTEDRADGFGWSVDLPHSPVGEDVRVAVERGDLRSTSWRMRVKRDEWRGDVRHVHEIGALLDVTVTASPAYGDHARAEYRSAPDPPAPPAPTPEPPEATVPDPIPAGGLILEDRSAADDRPTVEARVLEALRGVSKGEARDLATATVANVSPPELSAYLFEKLRATSIALQTGITVLSTDREAIVWPKLTGDVAPGYVAEGALIPETDPTFANLTATPKKLAVRTVVSNEVIDDSVPSITDVLSANMSKLLALKLDLSVFEGDGTANSIVGLKNTAGIQSVSMGTNGALFTNLDPFADAQGLLNASNAGGQYVIVMGPNLWQELSKLKEGGGFNRPLLEAFPTEMAPPRIYGMPVYVSSQLSKTETQGTSTGVASSVYVFAPSQVVLVRRQDATIELDRSRLFNLDQSEMRGKLRADLLVPNPAAVCRIVGVL